MHLEDFQLYGDFTREGEVGLKHPPADIYYRAAFLAMIREKLQNRLIGKFGAYACLQEDLLHKQELHVIQEFLEMYKATPSLLFLHLSEYSHNDVNMAKLYDQDFLNMMKNLTSSGALNNTFFMILG